MIDTRTSKEGDSNAIQNTNVMQNWKQNKLRYVLEEKTNDDKEPSKFLGYEDDTFKPGPGGTANYAFMVYDVILLFC